MTTPRILLVDSDEGLRKQVRNQLREQYTLVSAENGLEALDILRSDSRFDVLLVEMVMPLMDGLELARECKRLPGYESIPIIIMSRTIDVSSRRLAFEAGAMGILSKPLDPYELEFKLRNISELSVKLRLLTGKAHTDPLTGLPDQFAAEENIKNEFARCVRASVSLAVVKFRIDHYSDGSQTPPRQSSTTERLVANYLLSAFQRPNDRLGYLGQGEFILSTAEHTANPLRYYLESLRSSLEALAVPHWSAEPQAFVTLSVGAALGHPRSGEHPLHDFIATAEDALNEASLQGNTVVCRTL